MARARSGTLRARSQVTMTPRYPELHVHLRTDHPLAVVAAVRHALWRGGAPRDEIRRFSEEALRAAAPTEVATAWAHVDVDHRT